MAQCFVSVIESNSEGRVTEVMDRAEDYNSEKDLCVEDSSLQSVEDSSLQPVTSEKNHSLNEVCSVNEEMSSDTSDQEIDNATILLFEDTLTKHLGRRTEGRKKKLKWNVTFIDLRDFVSLILEAKGKWTSKQEQKIEVHSFIEEKAKFRLPWWMSSKTVFIQGAESPKIIKKVEELLGLNDSEADQSTQEEKSPNPKKKKRRKSSKKPKEDSEKSYCFEKDEISKLWEAIDDIKCMLNSTTSLGKADSPQVFP